MKPFPSPPPNAVEYPVSITTVTRMSSVYGFSRGELSKDEETPPPIPSYEELAVNTNQYNEYGEYTDVSNMLYPTSYIVYNPMEMPVYPSYMMPPDACCYYYMPPEIPTVQEYAPVPYQEYIPPVKGKKLSFLCEI
ncbi:hypothetical protein AVEN_97859-1 [Araneus ventricosus]|uniref:Uncharacterized protein n=1 Tax=Araneus ventricosus TaxID=182803 RepID=A0A4Y2W8M7_ARAVE|nr:hypothetical protein AVEN_97859-1 [Araneus ventricosus]